MMDDMDSDGEGQDTRGGKERDGKDGDKDKKGTINRVNRMSFSITSSLAWM
jgi:hypothetical protein